MKNISFLPFLLMVLLFVSCSSDENDSENDIPKLTSELIEQGDGVWEVGNIYAMKYGEIKFKDGNITYASTNNYYRRTGSYTIDSNTSIIFHDTETQKDYVIIVWVDKLDNEVRLYLSCKTDNELPNQFMTGKYTKCARPAILK